MCAFRITDVFSREVLGLYKVPNPIFHQLQKLKKPVYKTPEYESLVKRGFVPPSAPYWSARYRARMPLASEELLGECKYPKYSIELRDYQKEPSDLLLKFRIALLVAPTGSGKSLLTAELIKRTGLRTLVVCHTVDMVKQFHKTFKDFLGIDAGIYTGKGKIKDVTITTYNTAKKRQGEFEEYGFGMLIVDEADLFITDKCLTMLNSFQSVRKYGFTATERVPKYDDLIPNSEEKLMRRIWGKKIEVKTNKQTDILKKIVFKKAYPKQYTDEEGDIVVPYEWLPFRKAIDADMRRKEDQCRWILSKIVEGDFGLVLLDRVSDIDYYYKILSANHKSVYKLHGQMKDKEREKMVKKFKKKGGIMVGNIKILGRGYDNEFVNKAFIACPVSGESVIRQAIGRIIRWKEGKEGVLYDWIDFDLRHQQKKRERVYSEYFPKVKYFIDT